jgi:uncharacterized protein (TIGR02118 family)
LTTVRQAHRKEIRMIKVSVLYPNSEGSRFDLDYYLNTHMPMVQSEVGSALKGMGVDAGLAGGTPGVPAPYAAIGHLIFDSLEDFQASFGPKAHTIFADVPNYTDITPVTQISEIKL